MLEPNLPSFLSSCRGGTLAGLVRRNRIRSDATRRNGTRKWAAPGRSFLAQSGPIGGSIGASSYFFLLLLADKWFSTKEARLWLGELQLAQTCSGQVQAPTTNMIIWFNLALSKPSG